MKNILIVGANFVNKGAQSMLYITVDEIVKRIPDCNIYFGSTDVFDEDMYTFHQVYLSGLAKKNALREHSLLTKVICLCRDLQKYITGCRDNLWRYNELKKILPSIDLMIDVSGFNLGKKWSIRVQEYYLDNIRLAKKYDIPVYMMPQSFGTFDYSDEQKFLLDEIRELMKYPKVIYAREKDGYDQLINTFDLKNVKISPDLVLQNRGLNRNNIFKIEPIINVPIINGNKNIGIVPNIQCFNHGDKNKIMDIYKAVIEKLISDGFNVILFRHSREDIVVCEAIKSEFMKSDSVVLEDKEFSCFEYDEYVKQFDFIVCSRYHGLVHAYKNNIPCIALGWAVKYKELTECVGQNRFAFDITSNTCNLDDILLALDEMEGQYSKQKQIIGEKLVQIQKDNCFDCISV